MPTADDLAAIYDRLDWSWDHLQHFKKRLVDEGAGYHWIPGPEVETQVGRYVDFIVDEATPLPSDLKFILGDCIHSLRSSLDNLIYCLCPTDRAAFIIAKTRHQWRSNRRKVRDLPWRAYGTLYDVQPFHPKNGTDPEWNPLWVLDRLWNEDKHRAPHIAVGVTNFAAIESDLFLSWPIYNSGELELGSVIARVWTFSNAKPDLKPTFGFDIAFDSFGPARGGPVFYSLWNLHDRVREIVERFKPFFP